MADEMDTETPAQEQNVDTQTPDQTTPDAGPTPVPSISDADFQRLGSWMGRMVAEQIDKKVVPLLNQQRGPLSGGVVQPPPQSLQDLNIKLQDMIFSGKVTEALDAYVTLKNADAVQTTARKSADTRQALTSYSEKPDYKEIYPEMEKLAIQYVSQGFPPAAAAQVAYSEARAQHLEGRLSDTDTSRLNMTTSGTPRTGTKKVSLPDRFKKAAARDIAAGVFKDEADYIRHLSPDVRKRYGI